MALFGLVFVLVIYWVIGNLLPKYSKLKTLTIRAATVVKPSDILKFLSYNIDYEQGVKNQPTD